MDGWMDACMHAQPHGSLSESLPTKPMTHIIKIIPFLLEGVGGWGGGQIITAETMEKRNSSSKFNIDQTYSFGNACLITSQVKITGVQYM